MTSVGLFADRDFGYCLTMALEPYLQPGMTLVLQDVGSRDELFRLLSSTVDESIPALNGQELFDRLVERERQHPTSTPEGVAFPHALSPDIEVTQLVVACVDPGVDFGVPEHPVSDLIFCMFGPTAEPWEHVRLLARFARICRTEEARARLRAAVDAADLYTRLLREDRSHG